MMSGTSDALKFAHNFQENPKLFTSGFGLTVRPRHIISTLLAGGGVVV